MDISINTGDPARITTDFDHHDPRIRYDYHAAYDGLRSKCPVVFSESNGGYWALSSYEHVREAASKHQIFSSDHDISGQRNGYQGVTIPPQAFEFGFTEQDPPETTRVRAVLSPFFTPAQADTWTSTVRDITTACIDRIIEAGEADFVDDLGSPVPALVTMVLFDLPLERWELFASANHLLLTAVEGSDLQKRALSEMGQVIEDLKSEIEKRSAPGYSGNDAFTALCQAEVDGRQLSPEEKLGTAMLLVIGGVDTTTSALGTTIKWLSQNPEERARLRNDPELMKSACEEFLRAFAPVTGNARTCTRAYEMNGQQMKPGDRVQLSWAAANMDPEEFDDPHDVRLDRSPNRHATFGFGIHRCLGSNVARLVFRTVIEEVINRMPDFEIDYANSEPYPTVGVNRGYVNMPMKFTPGSRIGSDFQL